MAGLSGFPGFDGTVQLAVEVLVMIVRSLVHVKKGIVKVLVWVLVTGLGVTVTVRAAVLDGIVIVERGPTVEVIVMVVVLVTLTVGILVMVYVAVGVVVVVCCGPTSR